MKVIKESKTGTNDKGYDVIQKMEEEWPLMTEEFKKIQREQYELFLHKQHDYGPGNISVGTFLVTPEEIKLSPTCTNTHFCYQQLLYVYHCLVIQSVDYRTINDYF